MAANDRPPTPSSPPPSLGPSSDVMAANDRPSTPSSPPPSPGPSSSPRLQTTDPQPLLLHHHPLVLPVMSWLQMTDPQPPLLHHHPLVLPVTSLLQMTDPQPPLLHHHPLVLPVTSLLQMTDPQPPPPPPSPGPSTSASRDQPDGQSRNRGKRKLDKTDMPDSEPDTKRSRVTSDDGTTKGCSYRNIDRLVAQGQYQEALAYTRTKTVSSKAKLRRHLEKAMVFLITDKGISGKVLGPEFADVMMCLLSERLEHYSGDDEDIFNEFFCAYFKPDTTETLFKLVNKHTTNLKDKRTMWRIMFCSVVYTIEDVLQLIGNFRRSDMPDDRQKCQKELAHLVELLPATLHGDSDPAISLPWLHDSSATRTIADYTTLFAKAVEFRLVQEAKLLYEAGAVNNAGLMAVANKADVQKTLKDEEDQSKMAVFLRKVLKQPRRLESMALLQVSRLVGQDFLGREDRVRQLPLSCTLRDAVLLRPVFNRYRKEIECNDQSTDGGV